MDPTAHRGRRRALIIVLPLVAASVAAAVLLPGACSEAPRARAYTVTHRDQLVGGPRALGEVGDILIENDQIRVVIQGEGFSRGFGIYGGGLIDADLVRHDAKEGDSVGGGGRDNFGEMFSALFLEAMEPLEIRNPDNPDERLAAIEVTRDGSDGVAEVTVRSKGSDFLGLTYNINNALLGQDQLLYTNIYRLRPGQRFIEIETRVQNINVQAIDMPSDFAGVEVPAPTLDVMLFGAGNQVFVPLEAGFDIRYSLEDIYADTSAFELPAFPGLVAEFVASRGKDVSYGLVGDPEADSGYTFGLRDPYYPDAKRHSLLVPFLASAFTGVFSARPPLSLAANDGAPGGDDEFVWKRYFFVGSGDIASISDAVYDFLGDETGELRGRVLENESVQPVPGAMVIITDADDRAKVTQCDVDNDGRFGASLRPGSYHARVVYDGRAPSAPKSFDIAANGEAFVNLSLQRQSWISVTVVEEDVGPIPAKASAVGVTPEAFSGRLGRDWLYDLSIGEHERYTDLQPDTDDPQTRRYIEAFDYTTDGSARLPVRPGSYTVFVGRGLEYSREEFPVDVGPGQTVQVNATLRRVIDTSGYIGADFHLHTANSLDSSSGPGESLAGYAGEGLEYVVPTDHNFVTDLLPAIGKQQLEDHLATAVGLELTTLDRGHFNGFPIVRGDGQITRDGNGAPIGDTIASRTYGSFEWALQTPDEIFSTLRGMSPDGIGNIIQVNHPRSPVLGYFYNYGLLQDTLVVEGQGAILSPPPDEAPHFAPAAFSWEFDAMEIFNGKSFEEFHNFRVPEGLPNNAELGQPLDPASCCPINAGEVYFNRREFECDPDERDCTCTADDARAQLDAGNCEPLSLAFPGNVEDWFEILKTGRRVIGTANSDSHGAQKEEPGFPRTFVAVPDDRVSRVSAGDVVDGLRSGNVTLTYGPFVTVSATSGDSSATLGGVVQGAQIDLAVRVQTAPWVDADTVVVYLDGEEVERASIPEEDVRDATLEFTLNATRDGFIVVEVTGGDSLFPTLGPREFPSLQFADVLDSVAGSFGLGLGGGGLLPNLEFPVTPAAMTNPIFIDADGDGEIRPIRELPIPGEARTQAVPVASPVVHEGPGAQELPSLLDERTPQALAYQRWLARQLPRWMWPSEHPRDARRVFLQFLHHAH